MVSCEINGLGISFGNGGPGNYSERTDYLCSRSWGNEWYDRDGTYYYQELRFYPDATGVDYLYRRNSYSENESTLRFKWDWWNAAYTSLRLLYYEDKHVSYFDNILMSGNQLNGVLDGESVFFIGQ